MYIAKRALPAALAGVMTTAVVAHMQEMAPTIRTQEELAAKGLLAETDEDFLKHAARAGVIEIQTARLALTKTSNAEVKAFAEMLVNDHTAIAKELAEWASKKNIVLKDDDPSVKMKLDKYKSLEAQTGADFDRQFLDAMISHHSDSIMLYGLESRNTKDPALKKYAQEMHPRQIVHTNAARRLRAKLTNNQ